jgi:hypothetical protein
MKTLCIYLYVFIYIYTSYIKLYIMWLVMWLYASRCIHSMVGIIQVSERLSSSQLDLLTEAPKNCPRDAPKRSP